MVKYFCLTIRKWRGAGGMSVQYMLFSSIIYVILGVAISVVILMQEGKSNGLGSAIGGISSDSVTGVRTEAVPWKVR